MAKRNSPGIVSKATSIMSLAIGLGQPVVETASSLIKNTPIPRDQLASHAMVKLTGYDPRDNSFDIFRAHWSFGLVAAYIFKRGTSMLLRRIRIKDLF